MSRKQSSYRLKIVFHPKVCVLHLVKLEDDIGYIKSSHTSLSSSNWTISKTRTLNSSFLSDQLTRRLRSRKCSFSFILKPLVQNTKSQNDDYLNLHCIASLGKFQTFEMIEVATSVQVTNRPKLNFKLVQCNYAMMAV